MPKLAFIIIAQSIEPFQKSLISPLQMRVVSSQSEYVEPLYKEQTN